VIEGYRRPDDGLAQHGINLQPASDLVIFLKADPA
jgi:hypothetical protein